MEKSLYKPLPIKSIAEAAKESLEYIDYRRKGLAKSLLTPWEKYNKVSMNGLEWHTIHIFAGASGSGKTALLNQLETGLFDLNPDEDFAVLSFNFEMLARNLVSRKFSNSLKMTVQELHSGRTEHVITDNIYNSIVKQSEKISQYPIYYCDVPGTVLEIYETITKFKQLPENQSRGLVVLLDHSILVKGQKSELERTILVELMTMFNYLKKQTKITTVLLSQLNRDSETVERLSNPQMHYPKKKDLFGSDALYQFADMVSVIVNPEMLGLETYGPKNLPVKGFLYLHCLKVREGEPCILRMTNNLKYNEIRDYYSPNTLYNMGDL